MRGRDANGKKNRWSKNRKLRDAGFIPGKKALEPPREPVPQHENKKRQNANNRDWGTKKKKKKQILTKGQMEGTEDIVADFDIFNNNDEEDRQIRDADAEKRRLAAVAAAKSRRQIFVAGIPWKAEEDAVRKFFGICGKITDFVALKDKEGKPRGIAFITFDSEDDVAKALLLDGKCFDGRELSVKVSKNKQDRKKQDRKGKGKGKSAGSEESDSDDETDDSDDDDAGKGKGKDKSRGKGKGKGKGKDKGKAKGKGKGKGKAKGKFQE